MKPDHWMPLYVGDYLRDTLGLGRAEHGSYLLLIFAYWTNGGPLPDDGECLREIAKCPSHEWQRTRGLMLRFFTDGGGFWTHKRVDLELAEARKNCEAAYERTKKAREAKEAKAAGEKPNSDVTDPVTTSVTDNVATPVTATPSPSPSPIPIPPPESSGIVASRHRHKFQKPTIDTLELHCAKIGLPKAEAMNFWHHHEARGWMLGKNQMKSWQSAMATWKSNHEKFNGRHGEIPEKQQGRIAV